MNGYRRYFQPLYGSLCVAFALGCASQSKEPGRAAIAPPSAEANPAPAAPLPQIAPPSSKQPAAEAEFARRPPPAAANEEQAIGVRDADDRSASTARQRSDATPPKAGAQQRGAPAPASKAKREAVYDAPKAPTAPAESGFAEPPELQAAMRQFESDLSQLSTSRACEDACRALESMRRSAQRICDIVVSSDPRERCRSARDRLEQAARDLGTRCTDCH